MKPFPRIAIGSRSRAGRWREIRRRRPRQSTSSNARVRSADSRSATSRRSGRGTPTSGGHAPRQSAALPSLRGRSGSESSRDARILRLRDPARPPAAVGGAHPPPVGMPRGSRPRCRLSGAAPAPNPRGTRGSSDFATQRDLPPQWEGHTHLRWACPEAVGRAAVSPGPLRLRILAGREDPPTSRPSATSRRSGRGTPTSGGHAPRQSAALPSLRGRSGSESSRDARILRLRDPARPPAAVGGAHPPPVGMPRGSRPRCRLSGAAPAPNPRGTRGSSDFATQRDLPPQWEGHTHLRWACPEAVGRAAVSPGPLRLRILAGREDPPTSRPSATSRRSGRGTPTSGGHAPRQSAALPSLRGRSGSESSRDASGVPGPRARRAAAERRDRRRRSGDRALPRDRRDPGSGRGPRIRRHGARPRHRLARPIDAVAPRREPPTRCATCIAGAGGTGAGGRIGGAGHRRSRHHFLRMLKPLNTKSALSVCTDFSSRSSWRYSPSS